MSRTTTAHNTGAAKSTGTAKASRRAPQVDASRATGPAAEKSPKSKPPQRGKGVAAPKAVERAAAEKPTAKGAAGSAPAKRTVAPSTQPAPARAAKPTPKPATQAASEPASKAGSKPAATKPAAVKDGKATLKPAPRPSSAAKPAAKANSKPAAKTTSKGPSKPISKPDPKKAAETVAEGVGAAGRVEVRNSAIHGLGLFATARIRSGEQIGVYAGPRSRRIDTYVLWVEDENGKEYGIDGKNEMRYVNHSNEPNASFEGEELWALRRIEPGEEITHHYGEDWEDL